MSANSDTIVRALRGDFSQPSSNANTRAIVAAIRGEPRDDRGISHETLVLSEAFRGRFIGNDVSLNGLAIIAALKSQPTDDRGISRDTLDIVRAIFNQEDGDGDPVSFESGTYAQMLGGNWPVGTEFHVSDWEDAGLSGPIQTRIAASTAQGGVAIIGGTQDGIYPITGTNDGKTLFNLLGSGSTQFDSFSVTWREPLSQWMILGDGQPIYYSLSDVATPDLATNWKNFDGDTPASIIVTSVTEGEIYAGLRITNDGATNGSSYVSAPFAGRQYYMGLNGGGSNNLHWDTDFNVWTDDVGAWTTSNVAFPWQGADNGGGHTGATFARNDVANARNWITS